jgi:undecaprenyl-diphosphatase
MSFFEKHRGLLVLNFSAVMVFLSLAVIRSIADTPFDLISFGYVRGVETNTLTNIMIGISKAMDPAVLLLLALALSIFLALKKKVVWAIFFLLTMFCAVISAILLKDFFHIARPVDQIVPEIGWGFPSSHATMVAVFFFSILYGIEEKIHDNAVIFLWILVSVGLTLATGFSRVYLGVHFATDVLAGFALGTFWVTLAILSIEKLKEREF